MTDLEIRLTHQEAAIEEINSVLLKQHNKIESLIADFVLLQKQLRDMTDSHIADQSLETPPPHY